ncbi:MAG: tetratricopeptide repeat protein [Acidobacteriaceae bacterium]|nr:tetratricopeptide repeat protein [Acidobacteriaceae bacterium]
MAINEKLGQKRGVAAALDEIGYLQAMSGKSDDALASYAKALALQREIGMKEEQGDTLLEMGTVYQDRGDYDQALAHYKEALDIQRQIGDQGAEALCLNNIGFVELARGNIDNALTNFQQALQIREQLGVPDEIARSLEGLGEAYTHTGQYDQALSSLMRALDLARKADDAHWIANISHQKGLVFEYQGRVGPAVESMRDAVKAFRDQGEHGDAMASFLNDYAGALARAGRGDEAAGPLDEAEGIARDIKNNGLAASISNTRGDVAYYRGDLTSAGQFYQSALHLTAHSKDNDVIVQSKLNVAIVALAQGRAKDALAMLRPLLKPDSTVSSYLKVRAAIAYAEAEVGMKDYAHAQHDLNQTVTVTEKAGMRLDNARIYYLLGESGRLSGSGDRTQIAYYYRDTVRLLEAVKAEPGAGKLLTRSDLKAIYENASRWK